MFLTHNITPSSAAGKLGAGFALFAKAVTGLPVCLDEFGDFLLK